MDTLSHLDLAAEAGDPAIFSDPEIGVKILGISTAPPFSWKCRRISDREKDENSASY
jgi:hypothetical protein